MKEFEVVKFLVELDCLLDTRAAVLAKLSDDQLKEAFSIPFYERIRDRFPGVDPDWFDNEYKNRDKSILKDALCTDLKGMLQELVSHTVRANFELPGKYKAKIELNIYPYQLTLNEQAILVEALKEITAGLCDIEIVSYTYSQIKPSILKDAYEAVFMYDYAAWLECHAENGNFKKMSCPAVKLFGPRISFVDGTNDPNELQKGFDAIEELAAPFISLTLLPISIFSIPVPKRYSV